MGNSVAELETTDVFQGSGAVSITQRTASWEGLQQVLTDKFEFNVTYSFNARLKILNGTAGNKVKVAFRIRYDKPSDQWEGRTVAWMSPFPNENWTEIDTEFTVLSTDLQDYPILTMDMYFETPDTTADFLVDAVSMEPVGEITLASGEAII
jgi:hypothetical protein